MENVAFMSQQLNSISYRFILEEDKSLGEEITFMKQQVTIKEEVGALKALLDGHVKY